MKVAILCGGLGMRLREETEFKPKPMVEIGNKPILWHIMKTYAHYGFNDFVLCLGYRGDAIRNYFLQYDVFNRDVTLDFATGQVTEHAPAHTERDWRVTLAETGLNTMTGGRLKQIEKYVDGDTFMATYGDGVADIDVADLLAYHRRMGRIATLTCVRPVARFGELRVDDGVVERFTEKPQVSEGWINGGFFVFDRRLFDYIDGDATTVLERGPMEALARDGQLAAYRHDGYWRCMDTYRDMELLNAEAASGSAPWMVWRDGAAAPLTALGSRRERRSA